MSNLLTYCRLQDFHIEMPPQIWMIIRAGVLTNEEAVVYSRWLQDQTRNVKDQTLIELIASCYEQFEKVAVEHQSENTDEEGFRFGQKGKEVTSVWLCSHYVAKKYSCISLT